MDCKGCRWSSWFTFNSDGAESAVGPNFTGEILKDWNLCRQIIQVRAIGPMGLEAIF